MPRMEDGNNFGVEVQTMVIEVITEASGQVDNIIDYLTKYYSLRGAVVAHVCMMICYESQCIDKPYLKDIFQTLIEIDTSQFYSLKMFIKNLRDIYATIYDVMIKNYERIQNPRHSNDHNSSFFYFCLF